MKLKFSGKTVAFNSNEILEVVVDITCDEFSVDHYTDSEGGLTHVTNHSSQRMISVITETVKCEITA